MQIKFKKMYGLDVLVCLVLFLALGCRTNFVSFEKNASTVLIMALSLTILVQHRGRMILNNCISYIVWYSCVVLFCALSLLWCDYNVSHMVYALFKDVYVPLVCIMVILPIYMRQKNDLYALVRVLILAELLVVLRAILHTPWIEMIMVFESRLFGSGLGVNYNDFTTQMTLVNLIIAYMAIFVDKKYYAAFGLMTVLIFLTASRKSIVVTACGFCALYLFSSKSCKQLLKRLCFFGLVAAGALVLIFTNHTLYNLIGIKLINMIESLGKSSAEIATTGMTGGIDTSLRGRAVLREEAWKCFKNNPIIGIGYYCFQYTNVYKLYAHNNYLELLADLGLVGFCLYYSMYARTIISALYHAVNKRKCNSLSFFTLFFFAMLLVMEYAQITFFRLFALIPIMTVVLTYSVGKNMPCKNVEQGNCIRG